MKARNRTLFYFACFYFILKQISGIADHGAYYIQNYEDKLCITAGPVQDNDSVTLLKTGIPVMSNCSKNSNQQWVLNANETASFITLYNPRFINATYLNKGLNANISGDFINYFPNLLKITQAHRNGNLSRLYDPKTKECYQSFGANHSLSLEKCDSKNRFQLWAIRIANEQVAPGTVCSAFWSCNSSG